MVAAYLQNLTRGWCPKPGASGLSMGAAAWAVARTVDRPSLVVVPTPADAARMAQCIRFHLQDNAVGVRVLPPDDVRPYDGISPHPDIVRDRIAAIDLLHQGKPAVVVIAGRALVHRVLAPEALDGLSCVVHAGDEIQRLAWAEARILTGYRATHRVDEPGSISARGAVIDIWPTGRSGPVRIELFDDEIEEIRALDAKTQRSAGAISSVRIPPAREAVATPAALSRAAQVMTTVIDAMGGGQNTRRKTLLELRQGLWFPGAEDYLAALQPLVCPSRYAERVFIVGVEDVQRTVTSFASMATARWEGRILDTRPPVNPNARYSEAATVDANLVDASRLAQVFIEDGTPKPVAHFGALANDELQVGQGELAPFVARIDDWLTDGWQIAIIAENRARLERVVSLLIPHGLAPTAMPRGEFAPAGTLSTWVGHLPTGFHCPQSQMALITADEIFGAKKKPRRLPKGLREVALGHAAQLGAGQLVVHALHGVGRFECLKRMAPDGVQQEFAEVHYRGGDKLFLPVTRLDQLALYRTVGDVKPRLDKLGGDSWITRKSKVRERLLKMAHLLLAQHAERQVQVGHAHVGLPPEYHQFVETFPYTETPDQEAAIIEVLDDLAEPTPMDRLVVGDVGFGKTEVAMRAAWRVTLSGQQVAILCPTTVLAFQHVETFRARFGGLAVRVELLSGFRPAAERKKIRADLAKGAVDIVIGTTSLLGQDLRFRHLGLVVVDEEHRFGVQQKHKIKQLRNSQATHPVDYLAMSATPIPRTLHMALSGLRKVSLITTPPPDRRGVQTRVARFCVDLIRDEIRTELKRGGQVFFVHNRVQTIESVARMVREQVPEATVLVAHGQMDKRHLEQVIVDFIQRKAHVLVCTTIIESGVDIPTVNSMIVNRADRMGMAQLYQLRGRVGRSHVRARCTLLVPEDETMTRKALLRLGALQEHSDVGSGFAIATRDMEVRGTGTLLGEAQHGHIQAIGLDAYVEILEEAIAAAKGHIAAERLDPEIDVPVPCLLPEEWIPALDERMTAYRRLALCRTTDAVRLVLSDWEDLYGEAPPSVLNLGWAAEAKVRCQGLGISHIRWKKVRVSLDFAATTAVSPERIVELVTQQSERFSLQTVPSTNQQRLTVRFTPEEGEWPFRFLHWVFQQLAAS